MPSTEEAVKSSPRPDVACTPASLPPNPDSWNPSTWSRSSVPRTPSEVSTVSSTDVVATFSKSPKSSAPLCSTSRLICPSTSPSASPPISAPTPEDRPSLSAYSTIGRSFPETRWTKPPTANPTRFAKTRRRGRVSRKPCPTSAITWTKCKQRSSKEKGTSYNSVYTSSKEVFERFKRRKFKEINIIMNWMTYCTLFCVYVNLYLCFLNINYFMSNIFCQ